MSGTRSVSVGEIHTEVQVEGEGPRAEPTWDWEERWRLREHQRELLRDRVRTRVEGHDD